MSRGRMTGLDVIPITFGRVQAGLTKLFKFSRWRGCLKYGDGVQWFLCPRTKGDIQNCNNYMSIKLLCYTMKVRERVRRGVTFSENQFGFMPEYSTTKTIHLVKGLMDQYKKRKENVHMIFIDLENAYDKVSWEVLWRCLKAKYVVVVYTKAIKDM